MFKQVRAGNYASVFNTENNSGFNCARGKTNINNKFILLGLKQFDIFESVDKNFYTNEDCFLIEINESLLEKTQYYRIKAERS